MRMSGKVLIGARMQDAKQGQAPRPLIYVLIATAPLLFASNGILLERPDTDSMCFTWPEISRAIGGVNYSRPLCRVPRQGGR